MERSCFYALHQEGLYTMTELCDRFGVSRRTGYKWLKRAEAEGLPGLEDRRRAPRSRPRQTPPDVEAALVQARRQHPTWGPKKLVVHVQRLQPELVLPAASTAGEILKRHGLVEARPRRRPRSHPGSTPLRADRPNATWITDFKGEFKTGDGRWCYPLTVTDAYSRCLLACEALLTTAAVAAEAVFDTLFRRYGLPDVLRSDNGCPFASGAPCGLSRLSLTWLKLGIAHQRIRPGKPQENGRHERMHRVLKAETARPPAANLAAQQERFDQFRREYNTVRPHEGLGQRLPGALYTPSTRSGPEQLPGPEYAGHLHPRKVDSAGYVSFQGRKLFVSEVLAGETVGLEEVAEGLWSVHLYTALLGRWREGDARLHG